MLNLYTDDHKREVEHFDRLASREVNSHSDPRINNLESAVKEESIIRKQKLIETFKHRQQYLQEKYPKYLSDFRWTSKRTVTEIVGLADQVVIDGLRTPILSGNIHSVWGICSGQVHGKLWSSKTLSRMVHEDGWVHHGGEWLEVPVVNSRPDIAMLSKVFEFVVDLYSFALNSYYYRIQER